MDFSNDFTVPPPIGEVWQALLSLDRVLPLIPYTTVLKGTGSNVRAQIAIQFGAVSMTYDGDAEITERDDVTPWAVMRARAERTQGRSRVDARVQMQLASSGSATTVTSQSTVNTPVLGEQTGQATVRMMTERMIDDFAANLAALYSPPELAAA